MNRRDDHVRDFRDRDRDAYRDRYPGRGAPTRTVERDDGETLALLPRGDRERVRIALKSYQGHAFVDVRLEWTPDDGDTWRPTAKGATLKPSHLDNAIAALERAREQLRGGRRGGPGQEGGGA